VSVVVVNVATPPVTAAVPRLVVPSKNSTVPVGELPVTVAVRVTVSPSVTSFGDAARAVVVTSLRVTTTGADSGPSPLALAACTVKV
jgi:hypothetical protein